MKPHRSIPIFALTLSLAVACSKKDEADKAGDADEASGAKSVDTDKPAPTPVPPEPPAYDPRARTFQCDFVAFDGEGEERQAKFALTNLSDRPIKRVQSWVYYYDAEGKQIDRYPHALGATFEPGKKNEQKLGDKGDKIDEKTTTAACEITQATWKDGEEWQNENLVYNSIVMPRPLAGENREQLLARTGEKVTVTWDGKLDGASFTLKNTTDRPVMVKTAWLYYYDKTGKQLDRTVANLRLKIPAGGSETQAMGRDKDKLKEGVAVIEVGVSKIEFTDGDKAQWWNRNLAPYKRPMKAAPAPAE